MRYFVLTLILLAGLLFALAACTDSSSSPPNGELETSDGINVSLTTMPDPPVNGSIELVASVMDAQGQPVEDAGVFFMASHTDMAGMYTDGQGIAQGQGRYSIVTDLSMSGSWKVTVQVNQGGLRTVEEFNLGVE